MGITVAKTNTDIKRKNQARLESRVTSRITENIILVWLDPTISESDENIKDSLNQLRLIVNTIEIFDDVDECADFFKHLKDEIVFMVVSGNIGAQIVPHLEKLSQLDSVYVFCINKSKHRLWATKYRKVKGLYTQIGYICEALRRDIQKCDKISPPVYIAAPPSTTDSNELDQSFMYSQLFNEIVLEMDYDNKAKEDFANFCCIHYAHNSGMLQVIDEFVHTYDRPSSIWWYTRTSFIYSVLNKALRTQDLETIIMMGFILQDLHRHIDQSYLESNNKELLTVYRGQGMSHVEFDKIRNNQGGLISFHSFLSTSMDRQCSFAFAESARDDPDLIGILFQMQIDPSISSTPFVFLNDISYYRNEEKEYLFSMNTIFRIGETEQLDDRLWKVHLTLSSNNDEQLKRLIQHMRQEITGKTAHERLANLLFKMDKFDKAQKMFQTLLTSPLVNDWEQLLHAHYQLGYINNGRNKYSAALYHYKQSAEIALAHRLSTDGELFGSYSNIGVILHKQGDLNGALQHFQLAIDVERWSKNPDQLKIAGRHCNAGRVYEQQGNLNEAMINYERALNIQLVHRPPRHPSLIETYKSMASVQYSLKNYSNALSFYEKILQIRQSSLPPNDSSIAETHNSMATIQEDLQQYNEAIVHVSKAIDIARQASGPNRFQIQSYEQYHEHLLKKLHPETTSTDANNQ